MNEKIICTILIIILQIILSIDLHQRYKNEKYDIFNAIYQIIVFIVFQITIWIILK